MTRHIFCSSCGQRLEFEVEDFNPGQETNCPTCETVLIPVPLPPPPLQPPPPILPRISSAISAGVSSVFMPANSHLVQCQHCGSQMSKTKRVESSCTLQLFGVALFFIGLALLFLFPLFPIGTIVGLFLMLGAARLGYSKKKVWKCTNCGYFFDRA